MGLFSFLSRKRATVQRNVAYTVIGGNLVSSDDNKTSYLTNGYLKNDIIFSVVNLVAEKIRVAPWGVYKVEDESSLKAYRALMSQKDLRPDDYVRAMNFRKKALVEYTGDQLLNNLIKNTGGEDYEGCNMSTLCADSAIFKMITGDRMIWAEQLGAGANGSLPQSLHQIPPDLVTIVVTRTFPMKIVGYRLDGWGLINSATGEPFALTKEAVMHDKYFNPKYDSSGGHLFGLSPLKPGHGLMDMSNEATTTTTAQFQNQGPKRVMFIDEGAHIDSGVRDRQVQAVKKILQGKEYAGSENSGKTAYSGYKMGMVEAGLSPVDLGILDLQEAQLRRFCNLFGAVPSQVLNDPENKTYNNSTEGERALTTRGAIPLISSFRDSFNTKLAKDWGYNGKNIYVDADLTVYSELQDSMKDKWEWVKQLPVSWKYKLELMGLDYEPNTPGLKDVMIPTGFQPLDQAGVYEALNMTEDDGEEDKQIDFSKISLNGKGAARVQA